MARRHCVCRLTSGVSLHPAAGSRGHSLCEGCNDWSGDQAWSMAPMIHPGGRDGPSETSGAASGRRRVSGERSRVWTMHRRRIVASEIFDLMPRIQVIMDEAEREAVRQNIWTWLQWDVPEQLAASLWAE